MKAVFFVVVLLLGCSIANLNPAKRSLTCSGFPKQLSGRLYTVEVDESGSPETIDITFNLDLNLQIMQEETAEGILIMDFKGGKLYEKVQGECYSEPLEEKIMPDKFEDLAHKLIATGSLGYKGVSVDCFSFQGEEGVGVITLESGDQCIPVKFAVKTNNSAIAGSFLDLKTTVQPEKLKIPGECKQGEITRRSLQDMIQSFSVKEAKWAFPLFDGPRTTLKRRGFPWIVPKKKKGRK
ncbi:uncharacterized protein LOC144635712 [Oculina patagonica]